MKRESAPTDLILALWLVAIFLCFIVGRSIEGIFPAVRILFAI